MRRSREGDAGPNDPVPAPSKLVEDVLGLLEAAGLPTQVNDHIVWLIEEWEHHQESDR